MGTRHESVHADTGSDGRMCQIIKKNAREWLAGFTGLPGTEHGHAAESGRKKQRSGCSRHSISNRLAPHMDRWPRAWLDARRLALSWTMAGPGEASKKDSALDRRSPT